MSEMDIHGDARRPAVAEPPNRPMKSSDSLNDPKDRAEPVATASQRSLPRRPGWNGPTYYGRSQLKAAPFNKWIVGGYIFLGGLSGASALLSALASAVKGEAAEGTARRGRYLSLLAPTLGSVLLILDLHTPQRFYNMFRIAKRTSPMSIGTWILTAFSGLAGAAAAAQATADLAPGMGWARRLAKLASAPTGLVGAGLATYTAPLLSATSTPYWAASPTGLAVRFAASAMASGAAALSLGERSHGARRALETIGAVALAAELGATLLSYEAVRKKGVGESLKSRWGRTEEVAVLGLGVLLPLSLYGVGRLTGRRSLALSDLAALATLAGSAVLRVATLGIGDDSAARPEVSFRFSQPENLPRKP